MDFSCDRCGNMIPPGNGPIMLENDHVVCDDCSRSIELPGEFEPFPEDLETEPFDWAADDEARNRVDFGP